MPTAAILGDRYRDLPLISLIFVAVVVLRGLQPVTGFLVAQPLATLADL
jgi:hypothetical protein